ncbi:MULTISPECIES: sensor histidine kinase [Kribbella]|nr:MULTISPECIES: histidine kinase [Kribbella]
MTAVARAVTSAAASAAGSTRLPAGLTLVLVAMLISVIGIWATWQHSRGGATALAVATGLAILPWLASSQSLPDRLRLAMVASSPLVVAATAAVAVVWSGRAWSDRGRRLIMTGLGLAIAGAGVQLLGYDPFEHPSCQQLCARVPSILAPVMDTRPALGLATALTLAAAAVAVVAVMATARVRLVSAATLVAVVFLGALATLRWLDFTAIEPQLSGEPLEPLAAALVGAAAGLLHLRIVHVRNAVERLVSGLSADSILGGPVLDVQFAAEDRWLDRTGAEAPKTAPSRCVELYDGPTAVARLVLRNRVEPAEVLAGLAPATLLALRNAQLAAVAQARLTEVRASQRRVVAASDGERRRIERDLHDGAQQRLVGAGFQLRVALADAVPDEGGTGADRLAVARIECAESKVREALAQLRRLAHGIFPGVLVDEGLEPALVELVTASDVPAELEIRMTDDVAPEVAMAAYAMVAAWLAGIAEPSTTTRGRIVVLQEDGTLTVQADLDPGGAVVRRPDLIALSDRIGAVGGELVAEGDDHWTAVIPCGS